MAELSECKTCKGKVSSSAASCPHCGEASPCLNVRCPKCGSKNVEIGKQGFSLGKGALGAVLITGGAAGLVAGLHGRNNAQLRCRSCGKKWKPEK